MSKTIKYFLKRIGIFLIPFYIVLISFFILDPFKILYEYDNYSASFFQLNRDVISSKTFLKNYDKYKYNSYIFGSSRTVAFKTWDWTSILDTSDIPFSFDASNENIYGMFSKIKYLEESNVKINNALLVFCPDVTFDKSSTQMGHVFIKYPLISNTSWLNFYLSFLNAWFDKMFFIKFIDYSLFRTKRNYLMDVTDFRKIDYLSGSNDQVLVTQDQELRNAPDEYYNKLLSMNQFYDQFDESKFLNDQINEEESHILRDIKKIFTKNNTKFKVIIGPLFSKLKFSEIDLTIIKTIFGSENVFDFSGINQITTNYRNYYERSHYRPEVGRQILEIIYSKDAKSKIDQLTQN